MNVSDFMSHDCKHFIVTQSLDQLGIKYDYGAFHTTSKRVNDWILLHKQLRHIHTKRRARDLKFRIKIGTLGWCDLHRACGKYHADSGLPGNSEQLLQRSINSGYCAQCCQSPTIVWMDVLILVEVSEFPMRS